MVPGFLFVPRFLCVAVLGERGRAHCDAKCTTLKGLREHPLPGYDSELSFSDCL